MDHITPLSKGGSKGSENLQSLCKPCHSKKTREENNPKANLVNIDKFKTVSDLRAYLLSSEHTPAEARQAENALREKLCREKESFQRRL